MEYLKITKASNVTLYKRGHFFHGDLHLTTHHLIFTYLSSSPLPASGPRELWLSYPIIDYVELKSGSCLLDILHLSSQFNVNNHLLENSRSATPLEDVKASRHGPASADNSATNGTSNDTVNVIQNLRDIAKLYNGACLKIKCKDFLNLSIDFKDPNVARDVFDSIKKLTCVANVNQLYAFLYNPIPIEKKFNSWNIYNIEQEFLRQGLVLDDTHSHNSESRGSHRPGQHSWRISRINEGYQFCESYSRDLIVPKSISDNVLKYAAKFRSKSRIPCLTYYYKKNGCTITRSAQPLTGLSQSRSIQDEKLIFEIFMSNQPSSSKESASSNGANDSTGYSRTKNSKNNEYGRYNNLIIDARPTANAMAQTALGAGTEIIDNYKNCKRKFLGIDNIHVMRDSLTKVTDILKDSDLLLQLPTLSSNALNKTGWLRNISIVLNGVDLVTKSLHLNNSHCMVHCSDGWDRTTQICSLAEICLDPYYRTLEGFIILIEKDWLSFGHRFKERSGHLSSETKFVNSTSDSNNKSTNQNKHNSGSTYSTVNEDGSSSPYNPKSASEEKKQSENELFGNSFMQFDEGFSFNADSILNSETINSASKSFNKLTNHFKKKKHIKFTSPIFQQFLDCVYQIFVQFPEEFEFNERFLRRLVYHLYSCQYGNFLADNEYERVTKGIPTKTRSVWDYFLSRRFEFTNKLYSPSSSLKDSEKNNVHGSDDDVLLPNAENVKWWYQLYGRSNEEMNGISIDKEKSRQFKNMTRETNLNILRSGKLGQTHGTLYESNGSLKDEGMLSDSNRKKESTNKDFKRELKDSNAVELSSSASQSQATSNMFNSQLSEQELGTLKKTKSLQNCSPSSLTASPIVKAELNENTILTVSSKGLENADFGHPQRSNGDKMSENSLDAAISSLNIDP